MSAVLEMQEPNARYIVEMQPMLMRHYELLSAAPDSIARLRGLILTLALHGKLVAQDPQDAPATELLRKIRVEQGEWNADRASRSRKERSAGQDLATIDLPQGWEWVGLEQITLQITDGTHHTPKYQSDGIAFISVKDIDGSTVSFADCKFISEEEHRQINARCNPERGDLLLCRIGTLGRPTLVDTDRAFSLFVSVGLLKLPKVQKISRFLHLALSSPLLAEQFQAIKAGGSHTNKLNLSDLPRLRIPLPPLAEQARIVARVDELMRLCDALEAKGRLEAEQHARLLNTLLGTLTDSTTPEELATNWQRVAAHFDLLLDRPEAVGALEQAAIQLAIRGLLVKQDPAAEAAQDLLTRTRSDNSSLHAPKSRRRAISVAEVDPAQAPFEIPASWAWVRLGDLGESFDYGSSQKATDDHSQTPILRMGNIQGGEVVMSNLKYLQDREGDLPGLLLTRGDLLFNRTNSYELVGKTALFRGYELPVTFASYLIRVRLAVRTCNPEYVNLYMNSRDCRQSEIEPELTQQNGQANYNGTKLRNIRLPLPPLSEQNRIVARVTELRRLCADLRQRLAAQQTVQSHLADALVEQALA